jgi:hypothetical protein
VFFYVDNFLRLQIACIELFMKFVSKQCGGATSNGSKGLNEKDKVVVLECAITFFVNHEYLTCTRKKTPSGATQTWSKQYEYST